MDIIKLNRKAWNNIGEKATYPDIESKEYLEMVKDFCKRLPPGESVLDLGCGP